MICLRQKTSHSAPLTNASSQNPQAERQVPLAAKISNLADQRVRTQVVVAVVPEALATQLLVQRVHRRQAAH
jgi:hypothetical protein